MLAKVTFLVPLKETKYLYLHILIALPVVYVCIVTKYWELMWSFGSERLLLQMLSFEITSETGK